MPKINKEPSGSAKAESILIATTDGETVYKSSTKISDLAAGHSRSHAMTSTLDHTATAWRVFYTDASGNVTELALGTSGQALTSNGATSAPSFQTPGGIGISGTPVNNQLAVWTDANTLEGEADITYDQTTFTLANHTAMQLPSGYRIQFDNATYHINGQASKIQVAGTNFETEFDATIGAGGVGTSQLNVNANATGTTYLNFKQNSVIKGYLGYENTGAQMKLDSDGQIILSPNNTTAVTLATTGAATFASSVTATNFQTSATQLVTGNFTFNIDQTVGAGQDNYVLVYDNASGEIGLEAAGAGGGDVVKVGTPANNEFGIWTGDGTIKGLSGQLPFPATANLSANANTLDDYEEGTFTPTLQDNSGSDAEGQTYNSQDGWYTKIGNMVHFSLLIGVNSLGSLTTTDVARIAGLPFAAGPTGREWAVHCGRASSLALPSAASVSGYIRLTNAYIELERADSTAGTQTMQVGHVSSGGVLQLSGSYQTDL